MVISLLTGALRFLVLRVRMRPLTLALPVVVIFAAGCAWQSEALKIGQDTYQTSANASPARGGATGAREMALTNANKKCDSMGKEIEVTNTDTQWAFPTNSVVTVTFKCK